MNNPRYQGKPLLRLLECYVLKAIDALSPEESERLTRMQPKLAKIYGVDGTWKEIIEVAMNFPLSMPALIEDTWRKNLAIAAFNDAVLNPQQFAEMFVDQNFVP